MATMDKLPLKDMSVSYFVSPCLGQTCGIQSQFWYSKAAAARAATEELYFFLNDASNASCDSCITNIQPEHDRLFGEKINKSPDYSMFSPG
jgi:hypothetical protein